jgi:hypothetical protein
VKDGPFARWLAPMNRVMSRVPDFSKLPFAPAPIQFEEVRAEPWLIASWRSSTKRN